MRFAIRSLFLVLLLAPFGFSQQIDMNTQLKGSRLPSWGTDSGAANAYALTTISPIGSGGVLQTGSCFMFIAANASTGASTAAINGGSAIAVKEKDGVTALSANDIFGFAEICYDGTNFRLVSPPAGVGAAFYQTVQANGTSQTQRGILNLKNGTNTTAVCSDNSGAGSTDCQINSSGGGSAFTATYANDGTTGTTLNYAAQLTTQTGATARTCCSASTGGYFAADSPFLGICTANCGTTGSATITYAGIVGCVAHNTITANDAIAVANDGTCADVGFPPPNSEANSRQMIIGIAAASGSLGATVNIALGLVPPVRVGTSGFPSFLVQPVGSMFPQFAGPLLLNYTAFGSTDPALAPVVINQFSCLTFFNSASTPSQYGEITQGAGGCDYTGYTNTHSGSDTVIDPRTHNNSSAALDINAAFQSFPEVSNWSSNKSNTNMAQTNTRMWTLTGNGYMGGSFTAAAKGQWFLMDVCQDATGNRQYNFDARMQGAGFVPAAASTCMRQLFLQHDTNNTSNFSVPAIAPAIPIDITKTAQTASIAATAINAIKNNVSGAYPVDTNMARVCGVIYTTTAGTGGTVSASISYTDTTGTAQTDTLISSVSLTTLGAHSGNCIVLAAKDNAAISYSTTVSGATGSPQYMLKLSLEKLSSEID